MEQVASFRRGTVRLSREAASALARLGASLWSSAHDRIREDALRLQVARLGDDLLAALAPLLTRCEMLLEVARWGDRTDHLSASDQRCPVEGLEAYLARVRELELQVREAQKDLVALRGGALEGRSIHLSNLDVEICLLSSEIKDCEAMCRTLWADNLGAPALPCVA